ncbi:hypothetical protein MNV_1300017 [Candidatus Methanoperedens nitroreducens]|uniref:Uncharacterized protein n=1 Tax=Candidatus Methanoperedens nitratireducens TaxID=1392998 RepID=A0A284VKD9_9EURY|nr:hypothetical protein MNV_1300017 [Candidatus Methanoperedens nitroreducens]
MVYKGKKIRSGCCWKDIYTLIIVSGQAEIKTFVYDFRGLILGKNMSRYNNIHSAYKLS